MEPLVSQDGDFDEAMGFVKKLAEENLIYMVNSLNPFRLEGQKSIIWDILQKRNGMLLIGLLFLVGI